MSDIALTFPPWFGLAFFALQYWYFFALAGLALIAIAWFGRSLPLALRYGAWAGAVACAVPLGLLLVLVAADRLAPALRAAEERARQQTLTASETVGALALPAGAVLEFSDKTQRALTAVALPRPMPVVGIKLENRLAPITGAEWSGDLAEDQVIGDWPCRAGPIWFTPQGAVTRCTLAMSHRFAGYDLPAGAECARNPATGGLELQLPQDGPALPIPALNADLPPGGALVLAADGALRRLYVPHEARMTIAGAPLYDHIILNGTQLSAELAEPKQVAGAALGAGAVVRLDLTTGAIEAATRLPSIEPY